MADSVKLRAERHRRHHRGDHAICRAQFCDQVPGAGTSVAASGREVAAAAARSRSAGEEFLAAMPDRLDPVTSLLVREYSRCVDRLDHLHALLVGDAGAWATLIPEQGSDELVIRVNGALVEVRQQQNTLRGLGTAILAATRDEVPAGGEDEDPLQRMADELDRRRAARAARAAGGTDTPGP